MAMTAQLQNIVSEIMDMSEEALDLQNREQLLRARWDQNDAFNLLTDQDLADIPTFAHLTKSEVANAMGALDDISTALGDYVSGEAVNLVKMKG